MSLASNGYGCRAHYPFAGPVANSPHTIMFARFAVRPGLRNVAFQRGVVAHASMQDSKDASKSTAGQPAGTHNDDPTGLSLLQRRGRPGIPRRSIHPGPLGWISGLSG